MPGPGVELRRASAIADAGRTPRPASYFVEEGRQVCSQATSQARMVPGTQKESLGGSGRFGAQAVRCLSGWLPVLDRNCCYTVNSIISKWEVGWWAQRLVTVRESTINDTEDDFSCLDKGMGVNGMPCKISSKKNASSKMQPLMRHNAR